MPPCGDSGRNRGRFAFLLALATSLSCLSGCKVIPVSADVNADVRADVRANVAADVRGHVVSDNQVRGSLEIKSPAAVDPGEITATIVRPGKSPAPCARIGLVDIDGLLLNHNYGHVTAVGDNPLSSFREKLEAVARDPQAVAVLLRINSPGGSVTGSDIMAEELRQFRAETGKPVVSSLMDLATSGAYLVAVSSDRIVAHPTSLTGGLGVIFNHYHLKDAMQQLGITPNDVKSGEMIDMGTVSKTLSPETRQLLQQMADSYRDRLQNRVKERRTAMTPEDLQRLQDGRVVLASDALKLHLVDRLGYVHEAIDEAERLAGVSGAEVAVYHRVGYPARSLYAIDPTPAPMNDVIPFSYPGLDRSKLPTFLYLWQPDPTLPHLGSR
jgi:protease-4